MSVPQVFAKRDHNLNIVFWWIIRPLTSKNIAMIQHRDYHLPFHSILIVGLLIAGISSAYALEMPAISKPTIKMLWKGRW
jgi:hypothetical protein